MGTAECGWGVQNVVRAGPTSCGVVSRLHVTGVTSSLCVPLGFVLEHGIKDPGVVILALLFSCTWCRFQYPTAAPVMAAPVWMACSVVSPVAC